MLAALGGGIYLYLRLDDEIRQRIQQKIAENYPDKVVRVRSARFLEGQGIEIRGLTIAAAGPDEAAGPLVDIDEMMVVCAPSLPELIQNQLKVQKLVIRRPLLRATRNQQGHWDVADLLPLPKFGDNRPDAEIEKATVEVIDLVNRPPTKLTFRDMDLKLTVAAAAGSGDPPRLAIEGQLHGDFLQRIELSGSLDPNGKGFHLRGSAGGLKIGPELLAALPSGLPPQWSELQGLRAEGTVDFDLEFQADRQPPLKISAALALSRGRLHDPRLPVPLSDLAAKIRFTENLIAIDELTARHGPTTLSVSARRQGLGPNRPLTLTAQVRRLQLDRAMVEELPERIQETWDKYMPAGLVDVDLSLAYDGTTWRPEVTVHCLDTSFSFYKFPYRLARTSGTLSLYGDRLSIDLTAHAAEQPIRIHGELLNPGPTSTGWVEIRGSEIAADEKLITALPDKPREVIRAFHPEGTFQIYWRSWRDDPTREKPQSHMVLNINRGTVRYEKFAYPIFNLRGQVEMTNGHFTFSGLEGTNDSGFITCQGHLAPAAHGSELVLRFAATEVPLEEELRDALKPGAGRLWNDLKPRGRIDLTSEVRYLSGPKQLDVTVRIEPLAESTSIEPLAFPYRMENLQGAIIYRNGHVELNGLRARHGRATLMAQGRCELRPDRGWYLSLDKLSVDRIRADRDLLVALPPGLRKTLSRLDPTGPMNVRGSFALAKGPQPDAPLMSNWDLGFSVHRCDIDCGVKLTNLHGEVRLAGDFDGRRFRSRGELAIDSLTYKDIQFTEVQGPLWIDNGRVLLGAWAEREQGRPDRHIAAKLYGGMLLADGWVALTEVPSFSLTASLNDGDLARFAKESMPGRQQLKGRVLGTVELHGTARGVHTLGGAGTIRLRQADVGELPLMIQLLKVLRVRAPDATAFTQSDMRFRIDGEHLYFDKLDFIGDAVSLYGKGEMNFNREVQLVFHSVLGRNDLPIPFIQKFVGEASGQILQMHVGGTLEEPKITNEVLPGVNQALQQLQADLQGPQRRQGMINDPRRLLPQSVPK